jgi:hypothetical protein
MSFWICQKSEGVLPGTMKSGGGIAQAREFGLLRRAYHELDGLLKIASSERPRRPACFSPCKGKPLGCVRNSSDICGREAFHLVDDDQRGAALSNARNRSGYSLQGVFNVRPGMPAGVTA